MKSGTERKTAENGVRRDPLALVLKSPNRITKNQNEDISHLTPKLAARLTRLKIIERMQNRRDGLKRPAPCYTCGNHFTNGANILCGGHLIKDL